MYKKLIEKMDYANHKDKVDDILDMLMCEVKGTNCKLYDHIENEMYEMVYGKKISDEMADKWVEGMKPQAKWSKDEISNVASSYGVDIPLNCAYVIMNMLYSDSANVYGTGDDEESLKKYIDGTKDWYFDADSVGGEEKLYDYYKYIVKY